MEAGATSLRDDTCGWRVLTCHRPLALPWRLACGVRGVVIYSTEIVFYFTDDERDDLEPRIPRSGAGPGCTTASRPGPRPLEGQVPGW